MSNMLKQYLKSKKEGSSAIEFTITVPMTLFIVCLLFFSFMLLIAWVNFNALAGEIAKDLNFRQTGMTVANNYYQKHGSEVITIAKDSTGGDHPILFSSIHVNGSTSADTKYKNCIASSMKKYGHQFYMVYANYDNSEGINVDVRKVTSSGETVLEDDYQGKMSNHVVKVDIHWKFFPVNAGVTHVRWDDGTGGLGMTSSAYSVIT